MTVSPTGATAELPFGAPAPPDAPGPGPRIDPRKAGMAAFLGSEAAFFGTLVMAYVIFLGKSTAGPTPGEALSLPLVIGTTSCLLASSLTVHRAGRAIRDGRGPAFSLWWLATIGLGVLFLAGTAFEWRELIVVHDLTIARNMFGTTYYTLVGFHAAHVTAGVVVLAAVLALWARGRLPGREPLAITLTTWYWHFVDGVWVVVFTVVYLVGR